jgi:hypothetical protein
MDFSYAGPGLGAGQCRRVIFSGDISVDSSGAAQRHHTSFLLLPTSLQMVRERGWLTSLIFCSRVCQKDMDK